MDAKHFAKASQLLRKTCPTLVKSMDSYGGMLDTTELDKVYSSVPIDAEADIWNTWTCGKPRRSQLRAC